MPHLPHDSENKNRSDEKLTGRLSKRAWLKLMIAGFAGGGLLVSRRWLPVNTPELVQPQVEPVQEPPQDEGELKVTLRILIAYRDQILAPEEMRQLRKRIEEHDVLLKILQHLDHIVAAHVDDIAIEFDDELLDTNDVADYIDNTMILGQVANFEQLCLPNDVFLAELCSCHNILTTFLDKPIELTNSHISRLRKIGKLAQERAIKETAQ